MEPELDGKSSFARAARLLKLWSELYSPRADAEGAVPSYERDSADAASENFRKALQSTSYFYHYSYSSIEARWWKPGPPRPERHADRVPQVGSRKGAGQFWSTEGYGVPWAAT